MQKAFQCGSPRRNRCMVQTEKALPIRELTVEQKLKALFQLQTMLSKIDEIKTLRGELPLEVQDLEDEIAGLSTRIAVSYTHLDVYKRQLPYLPTI